MVLTVYFTHNVSLTCLELNFQRRGNLRPICFVSAVFSCHSGGKGPSRVEQGGWRRWGGQLLEPQPRCSAPDPLRERWALAEREPAWRSPGPRWATWTPRTPRAWTATTARLWPGRRNHSSNSDMVHLEREEVEMLEEAVEERARRAEEEEEDDEELQDECVECFRWGEGAGGAQGGGAGPPGSRNSRAPGVSRGASCGEEARRVQAGGSPDGPASSAYRQARPTPRGDHHPGPFHHNLWSRGTPFPSGAPPSVHPLSAGCRTPGRRSPATQILTDPSFRRGGTFKWRSSVREATGHCSSDQSSELHGAAVWRSCFSGCCWSHGVRSCGLLPEIKPPALSTTGSGFKIYSPSITSASLSEFWISLVVLSLLVTFDFSGWFCATLSSHQSSLAFVSVFCFFFSEEIKPVKCKKKKSCTSCNFKRILKLETFVWMILCGIVCRSSRHRKSTRRKKLVTNSSSIKHMSS